uniref:Uncharacterized protein n=1 Tax=Arion vulgaris TaxID=1028688 RepID=A0A0B7ARE1_9EUPU
MGPPDWWQEYEARKESGGTSSNSDISSVIEVTTMYLGGKKDMTVSMTSSTTTAVTTPSTSVTTAAQEIYLSIENPLQRRQSSPSLVMKESAEEDDILLELATGLESSRILHKSASCKSADLDIQNLGDIRQSKKSHRSAWGRVKDIIHTRRDSIKKKPKRGKSGVDSEETSEIDVEAMLEEHWRSDVFDEGLTGRSTPKSSPMVIRQQSTKGTSDTSLGASTSLHKMSPSKGPIFHLGSSPANKDMVTLLASSMSDEFNKKMQEWEQIRSKKSSFRVSLDESDIGHLDLSSMSHEYPPRAIDFHDQRSRIPEILSEGRTLEESNISMEGLAAPTINLEEIQRRMTDSFSRKMQEWERLKYKGLGTVREPSPESERKDIKGRKDERQKSKRSREEKEKEKWERHREREMQKVEREQVKLEKEKLRIEKERMRTLEREAKLEQLKGRLSQSESESIFKNAASSQLAEYKVTADFARKLHEWELKKGLSHDVSNSIYMEAQQMGMQHLRLGGNVASLSKQESRTGVGVGIKAPPPPPLALQPYWDSPEDTSPVERYSEISIGDVDDNSTCTSVTEECLTRSNITSLERANTQLLENLHKKEMEYAEVQEEVVKMNEKLANVRENHAAEMTQFHHELARGNISGSVKLEVGELETTVGDLEEKIKMMENLGEKLASSMESAAVGKWQSIEGEEAVHTQLMELVDQMRGMLLQASQSEEHSQKTMALVNFETLYTQAMKLQVQMNNLRLSHLERNREIMIIKRQLLLQEVNNLLLQADITRRETELYQFHEAKKFASLKRWNTFSGIERHRPNVQRELPEFSLKSGSHREPRMRPIETPRINIPHIPEEIMMTPTGSFSISAPVSPLSTTETGGVLVLPSLSTAGQLLTSPRAAHEQSTDHLETHLPLPSSHGRRDLQVRFSALPDQHQPKSDSRTSGSADQESLPLLQLPKLAIHVSPRKYPPEQSLSHLAVATTESKKTVATTSRTVESTSPTRAESFQKVEHPQIETSTIVSSGAKHVSSSKREITTICDSAILHMDIKELKREKRKVERGPPTLKRDESEGLSSVPSPVKVPQQSSSTSEAPNQFIPKQRSLEKPRLTKVAPIVDDDYFPEPSVMKCTENLTVTEQTDSELGAVGGVSYQPQAAQTTRQDLPDTSDQCKFGSLSLRSPISKHKLLSHKEERENKLKDYKIISPKGSPVAARGKPPLPRQTMPVKQSPSASSSTIKGPRSKSVSDVDDRAPESIIPKHLQDAIHRFDKRATVYESEDHPPELRKPPSPTLHLPRVGLVSRVRRLKPAAELLEESHRYRTGHSIYAARILQRYLLKDEHRQESSDTAQNKENLSGTYVHTLVQRLSRETTPVRSPGPSRENSDLSLKRTDSPREHSEFVTDIIRKLSSPSESEALKSFPPFRDLTNDGQVKTLTQAFNGHTATRSQERTLSDSDIDRQHTDPSTSAIKAQNRNSCEVAIVLSSHVSPISETVYQIVSSKSSETSTGSSQKPGSSTTPISYQSLPTITTLSSSAEEVCRSRAATYCVSEMEKAIPMQPQPSSATSSQSPQQQDYPSDQTIKSKGKSAKTSKEKVEPGKLPSSLSPDRRAAGRGRMGTVGVLCKQSISFDLGVSLHTQKQQEGEAIPKSRQARSWDPSESARAEAKASVEAETPSTSSAIVSPRASEATTSTSEEAAATGEIRPVSTSSEGEVVPSSPTTTEKKRSRRFFDSSWLQKSKRFFKVSK